MSRDVERGRMLCVVSAATWTAMDRTYHHGYFIAHEGRLAGIEVDEVGRNLEDFLQFGEDGPGPGVWVWSGWFWVSSGWEGEGDAGHDGEWRRATDAEVARMAAGDPNPFDPDVLPPKTEWPWYAMPESCFRIVGTEENHFLCELEEGHDGDCAPAEVDRG